MQLILVYLQAVFILKTLLTVGSVHTRGRSVQVESWLTCSLWHLYTLLHNFFLRESWLLSHPRSWEIWCEFFGARQAQEIAVRFCKKTLGTLQHILSFLKVVNVVSSVGKRTRRLMRASTWEKFTRFACGANTFHGWRRVCCSRGQRNLCRIENASAFQVRSENKLFKKKKKKNCGLFCQVMFESCMTFCVCVCVCVYVCVCVCVCNRCWTESSDPRVQQTRETYFSFLCQFINKIIQIRAIIHCTYIIPIRDKYLNVNWTPTEDHHHHQFWSVM